MYIKFNFENNSLNNKFIHQNKKSKILDETYNTYYEDANKHYDHYLNIQQEDFKNWLEELKQNYYSNKGH